MTWSNSFRDRLTCSQTSSANEKKTPIVSRRLRFAKPYNRDALPKDLLRSADNFATSLVRFLANPFPAFPALHCHPFTAAVNLLCYPLAAGISAPNDAFLSTSSGRCLRLSGKRIVRCRNRTAYESDRQNHHESEEKCS